jgi:hypothetical protein
MSIKLDKVLILNRLKSHYEFKTNIQLANFLDLKYTTLSNWFTRGTINFEKIFTICEDLNPNWIVNGLGLPKSEYKDPDQLYTTSSPTNEAPLLYMNSKLLEEVDKLNKLIASQEKTISAQEKAIEALIKLNDHKM